MAKSKVFNIIIVGMVCLIALVGCKDTSEQTQNYSDEAETLRSELMEVKLELARTRKDNVQLKKNIDELFEDIAGYEAKMTAAQRSELSREAGLKRVAAQQVQEDSNIETDSLRQELDLSLANVKEQQALIASLQAQLTEKDQHILELEAWIEEAAENLQMEEGVETVEEDANVVEEVVEENMEEEVVEGDE